MLLFLEVYVEFFLGNYLTFENLKKNSRRVKRVKPGKDELIVKLNKTNKLNENIKN